MSVRFNRTGAGVVRDHHELANKGEHTHAELDLLYEEVDAARSSFPDLNARLEYIQSHSTGGGGGDGGGGLPSNYLFDVFRPVADGETLVRLTEGRYEVGAGELEVFLNGIRLHRQDFLELSPDAYQLLAPLSAGDIVVSRVRDRTDILLPVNIKREHVVVTASDAGTYRLRHGFLDTGESLEVYCNGILQLPEEQYDTPAESTVVFRQLPEIGSLLLFQVIDKKVEFTPRLLEELILTDGTAARFTLTRFDFHAGAGELEVYLNGIHLAPDLDYREIDDATLEFDAAPPEGELLVCKENRKKSRYEIDLETRIRDLEAQLIQIKQHIGL